MIDRRAALALLGGVVLPAWGGPALIPSPAHAQQKPAAAPRPPVAPIDDPLAGLPPPRLRGERFRRGGSLGLFVTEADRDYKRATYGAFLDEMLMAGITDLQLITRWAQDTVASTHIAPGPRGEVDDETLVWVITAARQRGMRVLLMPIIHVRQRGKGEWRGSIKPPDWDAWWLAYRGFITHYARLAAKAGVETFAVGSELVSTERQADRWRALIAEIRAIFPGALTYSANWDHFEPVTFWDALDVAGLNGYHELFPRPNPTEAELVAGWRPFVQRVNHWANMVGKPYMFTEIGYPSTRFAAARPWDHNFRGPPDPQLQLRCYRAMYTVWQADPRLQGIYIWNWFGVGGEDDLSYTPRGKPAMHVLANWYLESRKESR